MDAKIELGHTISRKDVVTAVACKAAGGKWTGGHDISGHVFLLVLGSYFLLQEVGWVYLNHWRRGSAGSVSLRDDRTVVMHDGAVKNAAVEADRLAEAVEYRMTSAWEALGLGGKFACGVVTMSGWMLLMTAIFFHTWIEKVCFCATSLCDLRIFANHWSFSSVAAYWSSGRLNGTVRYILCASIRARHTWPHWSARHIDAKNDSV